MQESLEQIRAGGALNSRNLNLMLMEASILQKTGQSDSAMNLYRDLFVARGSRAAGRQLANLLLQTQQHQNALKQANRLVPILPITGFVHDSCAGMDRSQAIGNGSLPGGKRPECWKRDHLTYSRHL